MKPLKTVSKKVVSDCDNFQTPPIALQPLLPYIKKHWRVWDCACGEGNINAELSRNGIASLRSDKYGEGTWKVDFLSDEILYGVGCLIYMHHFDCIVTNPPYRFKDEFLARCYEIGKPFALLMPITALEGKFRQKLYKENGIEIIFMDKRINYITPNKVAKSSAHFASAWFTWGLNIGKEMTFAELKNEV